MLVGCTTFVCTILTLAPFPVQMVVLDEASMSVEPDVLMAVLNHLGELELLVLTGGNRQFGPVVPSESSGRNPLGNMLAVAPLQRVQE